MTFAQGIVAYAVCWWLVLFMLLPMGVRVSDHPAAGHAPSAPENPQLRRKFRLATLLALLPTALIYFLSTSARAEDSIYHARSKACGAKVAYHTPEGVALAPPAAGAGKAAVAPADLPGSASPIAADAIHLKLQLPPKNYVDTSKVNADLSTSFLDGGDLALKDGALTRNGKPLVDEPGKESPPCP